MDAVSRVERLAVSFSHRRPGFDPRPVHVRYEVNKEALDRPLWLTVFPPSVSFHQSYKTTLFRRTNGRSLVTFKQRNVLFSDIRGQRIEKYFRVFRI